MSEVKDDLILYVDDEWSNRVVFEQSFVGQFHIKTVASGAEALEAMSTHPVAVIVTDQRMPGMSGNELLERVRTMHAETVRIVLTAYSDLDPILAAVNDGLVARYIIKPWDKQDLEQMLTWAVEAYRMGRRDSAQQLRLLQTERLVTMGTIASSVLHDLNQPLSHMSTNSVRLKELAAAIPALIELLAAASTRLTASDRQKLVQLTIELPEIADALVRGGNVAQDLLGGMVRVMRARPENPQPAEDPVPAIRYALAACNNLVVRARARLTYEGATALPPVRVPASEVAQVIINLVANAAQALSGTGKPRGRITVTASDTGDSVRVEVIDTGPGMPSEVLEKVGTPFYSTRSEGTGLGVVQCRRILERAGGRLILSSKPGQGTTATCVMPKSNDLRPPTA